MDEEGPKLLTKAGGRDASGCWNFAAHPIALAVVLAVFAFAVCYFRIFIFPGTPLLPGGDEIGFATSGSRIVAGQLPYRDFFDILPPGTDLTYAFLIKWFGLRAWIPGMVMTCLSAATAMLTTLIAGRFMRGFVIALPGAMFTGLILLESLDATHHWFSTIAVLAAVWVLLSGLTFPRIAAAGSLCGVAACFTQTIGAAAVVAFLGYIIWKARRENALGRGWWHRGLLLCGTAAAVFLGANAYFIRAAGISRWWYCLAVFPLRYYSVPAINNWRVIEYDFHWHVGLARWLAFPFVYATIPLVYIVFLAVTHHWWKKDRDGTWDQLLLVELTGLAMFLAIASSPSIKRLSTVSPPAMILLAWLLNRPGKTTSGLKIMVGVLAAAAAIVAPIRTQARWHATLDLPAGRTALRDPAHYVEYRWVLRHTHPGQFFFGMPAMCFPFHMRSPTEIKSFDFSRYTRPEQVIAAVHALEKRHLPLIILPPGYEVHFSKCSRPGRLTPFWDYLLQNYRRTRIFGDGDEVWERKSAAAVVGAYPVAPMKSLQIARPKKS
jgi:hypothetical protein